MYVEIRREGESLRVRRFGANRPDDGSLVCPGGCDENLTHMSYAELVSLGEGVWEFPATEGCAA